MSTGRRLTPRGEERRAQLIAHATRLFATKGYHSCSVADIVEGVGVGKGVFYWYFPSKEELFVEILMAAQTDMRRRQQREIADLDDPLDRIAAGVRASVYWSAEHRDLFHLFEFAATDETFADAVRIGRNTIISDVVRHLNAAIAGGRIPDRDPEKLAHAILGVSTLVTLEYVHHQGGPPEDVADMVADFCLGGIGVSQPS
ncbi:MAG: TetR/AcrR family transcriptional regulator [Microthrixaceae bacterium]|nr:TetR/AcrR family transcriptional regulator [Microthrixaceae bacterium]